MLRKKSKSEAQIADSGIFDSLSSWSRTARTTGEFFYTVSRSGYLEKEC